MKYFTLLMSIFLIFGCEKEDSNAGNPSSESSLYFPPLNSEEWQKTSPDDLGWNTSKIDDLLNFLEYNNSRAFIVIKNGKIVIEEYFGNNVLGTLPFGKNSQWYWASAGKTLTSTLIGIAQQEGVLDIENPSSEYLGMGWTSLTNEKEQLIKVKHHLTMTTGLEYIVPNLNCTLDSCLSYKSDAGVQWFYHNATYTLLEQVVANASGMDYNDYTNLKIESKIGMNGNWIKQNYSNVYWSTARDMARFGLLMQNKGGWENTTVLSDSEFYNQMITPSQDLNLSYGYLWWLNGKESIIAPGTSFPINKSLSENAPKDLFAGMGKNGQFLDIIPSKSLIVVRMGEAPGDSLVPISFHDEMWQKINLLIP